jgi:hypothetical protein
MRLFSAVLLLLLVVPCAVAQPKEPPPFEFEKELARLWEYLADKHADMGDEYKKAQVYLDARKQYDRSLQFAPELPKAWKGLGYQRRQNQWVPDKLLPDKEVLDARALVEARKKPDEKKAKEFTRCAERCKRLMEDARRAGDETARRVAALYVLYYLPDDAEARKLREHVRGDADWVPDFAKVWRDEGKKAVEAGTFGEELAGEDAQAREIGARFWRRQSAFLVVRTSVDETRAKMMHRHAEANMRRAMDILGVKDQPFGAGRRMTLTQVNTTPMWEAMLTRVMKLEGDNLEFTKKLQGTFMRDPWGFMTRGVFEASADDMIGNSTAIQVLHASRGKGPDTPPWITVGFSYLVTSQVLGSTSTVRYTIEQKGATASSHEVIPEFTKKSGSPELLREVALNDVVFGVDPPLARLLVMETNDVNQSAAAKAFALMEFFFSQYPEQARKWLGKSAAPRDERAKELETAFGKSADEIEAQWRQWVLARY